MGQIATRSTPSLERWGVPTGAKGTIHPDPEPAWRWERAVAGPLLQPRRRRALPATTSQSRRPQLVGLEVESSDAQRATVSSWLQGSTAHPGPTVHRLWTSRGGLPGVTGWGCALDVLSRHGNEDAVGQRRHRHHRRRRSHRPLRRRLCHDPFPILGREEAGLPSWRLSLATETVTTVSSWPATG